MRVAIFNGAGRPITIEDAADDPVGPRDVRIEVARCGVCGSDIGMTSGSAFDYATGCRMGHESAGTVIETGREVTRFRVGDRLAVLPRGFCGTCPPCRAGRPLFCESGPSHFGGFGERLVLRETSGFRLPDTVSLAEGALVEPMACGRRAFRMARLTPGETVLVLGAGSMGLAAVYWARRLGAGRIVVATRTSARHAIALAMGADAAVSHAGGEADALARALGGLPDVVVEATGKPGMIQHAIQQVRPCGKVVSLGMCLQPDAIMPAVSTFQEVSLFFPLGYSAEDFTETVRAFDRGHARAEAVVSETVPLDRLPALIEEMRGDHGHLKVQVVP